MLRLKQIQHAKFGPNQLYQVWIGLNNRPRKDSLKYVWTDGTPHDPTLMLVYLELHVCSLPL